MNGSEGELEYEEITLERVRHTHTHHRGKLRPLTAAAYFRKHEL